MWFRFRSQRINVLSSPKTAHVDNVRKQFVDCSSNFPQICLWLIPNEIRDCWDSVLSSPAQTHLVLVSEVFHICFKRCGLDLYWGKRVMVHFFSYCYHLELCMYKNWYLNTSNSQVTNKYNSQFKKRITAINGAINRTFMKILLYVETFYSHYFIFWKIFIKYYLCFLWM